MVDFLKVKGRKDLVRDAYSKGIINNDSSGLKNAKAVRARLNKKEEELKSLKQEIAELQNFVKALAEKINGSN